MWRALDDFSITSLTGVAVAGESTSTSTEGDMARTLEALLNPATTEGEEGETRDPGEVVSNSLT